MITRPEQLAISGEPRRRMGEGAEDPEPERRHDRYQRQGGGGGDDAQHTWRIARAAEADVDSIEFDVTLPEVGRHRNASASARPATCSRSNT